MASRNTHIIVRILNIRLLQLGRIIRDLGWFRSLLLCVILGGFGMKLFMLLAEPYIALMVTSSFALLLLGLQFSRPDHLFLKCLSPRPAYIIATEYGMLALPFSVLLLVKGYLLLAIALSLSIPIIAGQKPISTRINFQPRLFAYVPKHAFEWIAGLRKTGLLLWPIWLAGIGFSFHMAAPILAYLALGFTCMSFYEENESLPLLEAQSLKPHPFLRHKIGTALGMHSLMALPLITLFVFFHQEYWYILPVLYALLLPLFIFKILLKYANYSPDENTQPHIVFSLLIVAAVALPFLLPAVWLLSVYLYRKALRNLNPYLHDFNH